MENSLNKIRQYIKKSSLQNNRMLLKLGIFIVVISWTVFSSDNSFAAAGDSISNTATVKYKIGGVPTTSTASVAFIEDRLINFVVNENGGAKPSLVITNLLNAVMSFKLTNQGNSAQDFLLTGLNTSPNPFSTPADNFNPLAGSIRVFVEDGTQVGYQAAEDTQVYADELKPNFSKTIYLVVNIPAVNINDLAAMTLVAQVAQGGAPNVQGVVINADNNSHVSPAGIFSNGATTTSNGVASTIVDGVNTVQTVFNEPAGLNTEDIASDNNQDIKGNGQHADSSAFLVNPPIKIIKSVTVIDTKGGNDPHAGATLRYQLKVVVVGNTSIDNLVIKDNIPSNTKYVDGSIKINSVVQTDLNDNPNDFSQAINILSKPVTAIEADLSHGNTTSISSSANNIITFDVIIQ